MWCVMGAIAIRTVRVLQDTSAVMLFRSDACLTAHAVFTLGQSMSYSMAAALASCDVRLVALPWHNWHAR